MASFQLCFYLVFQNMTSFQQTKYSKVEQIPNAQDSWVACCKYHSLATSEVYCSVTIRWTNDLWKKKSNLFGLQVEVESVALVHRQFLFSLKLLDLNLRDPRDPRYQQIY